MKINGKNQPRRTITAEQLQRLCMVNSRKLPAVVEHNGVRKRWVGIGWVEEGKPTGREVLVT